ncbi:MAG TPA: MFS transporter, partial [Thermomicrobiaceae bacterium]|nr:MFS transporter [Thermomicrobiaceae bacterium]
MALWSRQTDSGQGKQGKQSDQSNQSTRERLASAVHPGWLNRDLSYLFWGRGLRSLSQGYLGVIVPLYLAELHYSAVRLGVIFTAAAAVSAFMSAAVGVLSDRYGRKLFLVILGLLTAAGGAAFAASGAFWVLLIAGAISTVGRGGGAGSGGAWGPYAAAEQALIAEHSGDQNRTSVFGAMSFIGVLTGAVGSLIAGMPSVLQHFFGTTQVDGDRILFFSTIFVGIAMAAVMVPVRETRDATGEPQPRQQRAKSGEKHKLQPETVRLILKFMATNTANGLGYGLLGPITVYWFYRRYGVGSGQMAELFFLINLATAPSYLFAARLAKRLGVVKGITHTRALSVVMLGLMPFMPTYLLAALLYILR